MPVTVESLLESIAGEAIVPFSFRIAGAPANLRLLFARSNPGPDRTFTTFVYEVLDTDLTVRLHATNIAAMNVLSLAWTVQSPSGMADCIDDVHLLDLTLTGEALEELALRRFHGGWSKYERDKFPQDEFGIHDLSLVEEVAYSWSEPEGRASRDTLPIWWLYQADGGFWFGPEFGGMWQLDVKREADRARLQLKLHQMHFALRAGEEVELPAVTIGSYRGDIWEGCLHLRRTIRDEFLPRIDGQVMTPPVVYQILTGQANELGGEGLKRDVELARQLGIESYVWASPWYRGCEGTSLWDNPDWYVLNNPITGEKDWANWWETCGECTDKPDRFPEGIKAHAEHLASFGARLGLWYDPRLSQYTQEYPHARDALLPYLEKTEKDKIWNMGLIDLSTPAGRKYMLDMLERLINRFGARWLWHDLNVEVRPRYFEQAEAEDRKGLTELAYHRGKHEVYDEILRRHPNVVIEWCASGGTMIDLGTLRRIHTIWVTDYTEMYPWQGDKYNTDATRVTRSRLNWIFPACLIMNTVYAPDQVLHNADKFVGMDNLLTQMGSLFGLGHSLIRWKQEDLDAAQAAIAVYKQIRGYLNQEFRGLLPIPQTQDVWDAWQFHDPKKGRGVMMFYRLVDCREEQARIQPHFFGPEDEVTLDVLLGQAKIQREGNELVVEMTSRAAVVEYRVKQSAAKGSA